MITNIAHIINPLKAGGRLMVVFTFKFDESYKTARSLVVAGWIADCGQWKKLEKRWQKALAYENKSLPDDMKISRYHAAEMNANDGEFRGWKKEKHRKIRFTNKLLKIVGNDYMTAVACGIDLKSFLELFPKRQPMDYCIPYLICMQMLMVLIGEAMESYPSDYRIALVHDHGDWDQYALGGYNRMVDNPNFEYRHRFASIVPLTWRDDVGLQSADLIAYEAMRWLDDHLWTDKEGLRKPLQELVKLNKKVYATYVNRKGMLDLRKAIDEGKFSSLKKDLFGI